MRKFKCQDKFQITNSKLQLLVIWSLVIVCNLMLGNWNLTPIFAQDKIVAVVNNEVITQKDLNDFLNFYRVQLAKQIRGRELESKMQSMKLDLLDRLIEDRLLLQEAKKSKITVDESRVKSKIDEIKSKYVSETEFQNDIGKHGLTQADLENKIREQLLMYYAVEYKVKNKIIIRPDEVTDFYNKNIKEFSSPETRELEILTSENADIAKQAYRDLKNGQSFQEMANKYPSVSINKLNATAQGELRKEIEQAVFKMEIGEVAGPLKVDNKFYIIKLNNIIPPKQEPLPEVQEKIHSFLFDQKMQQEMAKWLDEIRKQSYIKITQE